MTGAGDGGHYPALLSTVSSADGPAPVRVAVWSAHTLPPCACCVIAAILLARRVRSRASRPPPRRSRPAHQVSPREVNLIAREYSFQPPTLDLAPGETVVLHVINGGLVTHEAIIGDDRVQDAWEAAEAPHGDPPPGPTPVVSVPPDVAGVRIVVRSGRARRPAVDGPGGRGGLRVDRRVPHRRTLGQGHAGSRALGGRRTGRQAPPGGAPASVGVPSGTLTVPYGMGLDQQASRRNA